MAGLAVRLRELGADARVCTSPDEEFAERLAAVGVPMVPVSDAVRELVTGAPPTASDFGRRVASLVSAYYDAIVAEADADTVVVATGLPSPHRPPFAYPAHPYPPEVTDNRELWDLNIGTMNTPFGGQVNAHRAPVGLPPVDNVRDHVLTDRPWPATDPVLDPWQAADLDVVQTGAWFLPDGRPLPTGLEAFLAAGEPPVYVGFGSMALRGAGDIAAVAVEAVRAQGRRVVIARGWADLSPVDDKGDCFVVGEVNHQALFGRVAAVVHHGGAGTTTAAARAGAPQVVVPQMVDQPYWAGRVAAPGIGAAHDGPAPTVESLSATLRTALAPGIRERATTVAGTIRTDGVEVAAKLLLETAGRGGASARR
ncbi:glycosyltransferase [Streptomyces lavendulocolor]|uniref:glycosyltransferase n=1 Tax=Streptomyces lavendulocolor TaxID=67316 RepID=UPI003C2E092C